MSKKFNTELLLPGADDFTQISTTGFTTITGDLLSNNELAFYVKLKNVR